MLAFRSLLLIFLLYFNNLINEFHVLKLNVMYPSFSPCFKELLMEINRNEKKETEES